VSTVIEPRYVKMMMPGVWCDQIISGEKKFHMYLSPEIDFMDVQHYGVRAELVTKPKCYLGDFVRFRSDCVCQVTSMTYVFDLDSAFQMFGLELFPDGKPKSMGQMKNYMDDVKRRGLTVIGLKMIPRTV